MEWSDVTRLLLVGGSTRMPMVVEMLRRLTGLEPDHTVHPDEAVARGAALYAAYLLAAQAGSHAQARFSVSNVNSHSLGVEGIDRETLRKRNIVLIPRNTPLPAKVRDRFATKAENQTSIVLQVLEGESAVPEECTAIGRTVIRDLPAGLPKNWPVEVTFEYGANGRLRVHGLVPGTHQSVMLCLERTSGLSDESILRWKQPIDVPPVSSGSRPSCGKCCSSGRRRPTCRCTIRPRRTRAIFPMAARGADQLRRRWPPITPWMNWTHWTS